MSTPLSGFGATAASLALFTAVSATSQADVVVEDNTITLTQAGVTIIPLETVRLPDTPRDDGQPWPLPSPVGPLLVKATGDLIHPTRFLIEKSDVVMPAQNHQAALTLISILIRIIKIT